MDMRVIEFTKPQPPYRVGETAGFSPEKADAFLNAGVATKVGDFPKAPATAAGDGKMAAAGRRDHAEWAKKHLS